MDTSQTSEVQRVITREATRIVQEDEETQVLLMDLVKKAIKHADQTLEYGAPQDAVAVMKLLLGKAVGAVGMETTTEREEMYLLAERVFEAQRTVPGLEEDEMKELTP